MKLDTRNSIQHPGPLGALTSCYSDQSSFLAPVYSGQVRILQEYAKKFIDCQVCSKTLLNIKSGKATADVILLEG